MPYIIKTRADIPDGLLQTLDLWPNTSIREDGYQPVGQTGYRRTPENEAVTITAGAFASEASGLAAWLAANISSGAGTAATATLTADTQANLADGETFTISDGENTVVFEFKKTATHIVSTGNVEVDITGAVSAADVSALCTAAINASALNVAAVDGGGSVALTNENQNQPTAAQNATNSETSASLTFAISNFTGATDSAALTAAQAATDATDILALVGAGALDRATINGALTAGAINKEDVVEVLAILAGGSYTVPSGTVIETAGAYVNAPVVDSIPAPTEGRHVYNSGRLRVSFHEGRLALLTSTSFSYRGTTGAGVAVYNDDGTVFA